MTKYDKTQMNKHYLKELENGSITTVDEALSYKLGYEKAFSLNSVGQQRELLIAFTEDWNLNNCDDQTHITNEDIEDYLAIDCG